MESIQPFTIQPIFDILLQLDYLLQLYQNASAGGNISKVTLLNQLNFQINDDGWMHIHFLWGVPKPAEPAGFRIQGG